MSIADDNTQMVDCIHHFQKPSPLGMEQIRRGINFQVEKFSLSYNMIGMESRMRSFMPTPDSM
jgi:hypothetical protein